MEEFYNDLVYKKEIGFVETDYGGRVEYDERVIRGVIRDLSGDELLVAQRRVEGVKARLYSSDKTLEFGGIVDGYKIVYINKLMDLAEFYQYDLERVDI